MPRQKNKKVKKIWEPSKRKSIGAMICSTPGGDPLPHYEMVQARIMGKPGHQFILVKAGDLICPRIHIPANFDWKGNNALRLELFYNAKDDEPLVGLPIPRRPQNEAINIDVDKWPIWHNKSKTWRDARFEFRELSKDLNERQNEYTYGGHAYAMEPLGQIRIALTRMRILEYHEEMELPDLGDQEAFRTMSSTASATLLKSVDLNIGQGSFSSDMIDNPIDIHRESAQHKNGLLVQLEAVKSQDRPSLGLPVCFSEYFKQATAIDPLKLFPKEARLSADELEQEQVLQDNMGHRDTRPGSLYSTRLSHETASSHPQFLARINTRDTAETLNEIDYTQFQNADDDIEYLYTIPLASSSPAVIVKSEAEREIGPTVRDASVSSSGLLKRAAFMDSDDGEPLPKVQKLMRKLAETRKIRKLVEEEADIEKQLERLQKRDGNNCGLRVKREEDLELEREDDRDLENI
ncbi:hypothetical protein MMC11_000013 [Xylographa trunciseda]|nr:hypothetical protein [Xylographa trunciseda]